MCYQCFSYGSWKLIKDGEWHVSDTSFFYIYKKPSVLVWMFAISPKCFSMQELQSMNIVPRLKLAEAWSESKPWFKLYIAEIFWKAYLQANHSNCRIKWGLAFLPTRVHTCATSSNLGSYMCNIMSPRGKSIFGEGHIIGWHHVILQDCFVMQLKMKDP